MTSADPRPPAGFEDAAWRERLTAYLDGELSPAEASEVLAWLETHPAALRGLEEDRRVWACLSAYRDEPVPAGFADRVLRTTVASGAETAPDARGWRVLQRWEGGRGGRVAAMAATVVLAVGVGALAAGRLFHPSEPAPASSSAAVLEAVPAALLESDDAVKNLASLSDDEFDAILHNDPEAFAQVLKASGG